MKKTTAVALIVLLAATMLFSACDLLSEPFPEETYIDTFICYPDTEKDSNIHIEPDGTEAVTETDTPTAPADPYAGLSEEERHIREVADAALLEAYELPSWENFRIEISYGANGNTNIYGQLLSYVNGELDDESDAQKVQQERQAWKQFSIRTCVLIEVEFSFFLYIGAEVIS